ncbi:hypothetical protein B0T24DRAFT_667707 [Lasiosphaeria ovina]|uniref:Fucose-specific lectin n=1 Tax=Lasiosphaeria ovina TaxID=92902 RepID=A0AAE0N4Y9_9PEZI|nr:hypothetical protein B0T24DRAFT_667707 [Lasiosphaeria ovina]
MAENKTQAPTAAYTKFNLAAVTFVHPRSPPDIKQCPCEHVDAPQAAQAASKFIRVYHTERSGYPYNRDSWLIRETRYSTEKGWHPPNDDLVADDAAPGSPVAAVGWWLENEEGAPDVWETRVYYIDKLGNIRERTNHTSFGPSGIKDDFDSTLPEPANLVLPTPGWKLTPLANGTDDALEEVAAAADLVPFPKTTPLPGSKLSAFKVDSGALEVFYQASDESIKVLEYVPGNTKWNAGEKIIVGVGKAKAGTPLAALVGGWMEHRLFYVTPENKLAGIYGDGHTQWRAIEETLSYQIPPSAMISAVAWNYGTRFFEIRIYTTDDNDALYEISYSRHLNGWKPHAESVAPVLGPVSKSLAPGGIDSPPLSAVAAILLEGDWKTKVYFHPRRTIGEWDVCAKAPAFSGIPKASAAAAERRELEEKTRALIKADEERRAKEEEERKEKEEAERAARIRAEQEAAARRGQPQPKPAPALMLTRPIIVMGDPASAPDNVDDVYKRVSLPFDVSLFESTTTRTIWISDNGIISIEGVSPESKYYTHDLAQKYKDARRLPFNAAADFSKHALFPLWADLLICKGSKHGVFYQVSGEAPARTLTVEWLVTQYGATQDYYHFSVTLYEARRGVATFKYNAVDGDAGSKCTVGAQGGAHFLQFSHNDSTPKIAPGVQVEFDTVRGTVTPTTFTPTARGPSITRRLLSTS